MAMKTHWRNSATGKIVRGMPARFDTMWDTSPGGKRNWYHAVAQVTLVPKLPKDQPLDLGFGLENLSRIAYVRLWQDEDIFRFLELKKKEYLIVDGLVSKRFVTPSTPFSELTTELEIGNLFVDPDKGKKDCRRANLTSADSKLFSKIAAIVKAKTCNHCSEKKKSLPNGRSFCTSCRC